MTENKIAATLFFVFNHDLSQVLLIKKQKPIHHAGLLNGLGGRIELGENHLDCAIREVKEEAGIKIRKNKCIYVGEMSWEHWHVTVWTCKLSQKRAGVFPDPNVSWFEVSHLPKNIIPNLSWLVPLSLDIIIGKSEGRKSLPVVNISYLARV